MNLFGHTHDSDYSDCLSFYHRSQKRKYKTIRHNNKFIGQQHKSMKGTDNSQNDQSSAGAASPTGAGFFPYC